MLDVGAWLRGLGLGRYVDTFAANDVDGDVLAELTDEDLVALGVSLGHRKKILRAIRQIASEDITAEAPGRAEYANPSRYTPSHLADRIRAVRGFLEGERKQVTVLFADIKGSLELIEGGDPERAHAILDLVIQTMMDAVHRYEGTVNKVLGDGIMALFGAPIGHEDHAARACYAALAMIDAIAGKAADIRREHGVEVQVRVGLNSGEVVVRGIGNDLAMDYDAIGPTTHLAGRMEQLAPPGTARLSVDTARLAEGFIEARSLGSVPVKGLKSPVELFELTGASERRSRFQAAVARGLSRFVGREGEMVALRGALDRAGRGRGQVFATIGEPGLGKSRLYYEFVRMPDVEGWLVLAAGSVSYGKATAYLPVVDLLKDYFRIGGRDAPRRIREKVIGKLLTLDESLRSVLPPILSLLDLQVDDTTWGDLDPAQRRRRTIEAIKVLLLRESRVQPLVVMFEDLHWIDGETQAVLDALVESLPKARIQLLVNYRPEYNHDWGGLTYYAQRRLEPLPQATAETLLGALVGEEPALDSLKRLLIERTEGNPFFVEESVRTLVEVGALTGHPGAYRLSGDIEALEIPASVQGILAARIDRLSAEDKRLLHSAAVVGKDVPFLLLQAVTEAPEDRLNGGLSALQRAEFLYETRLFPEREYTFKHALTHEVAYGSLLSGARATLHRKIAEAMERVYADRLAEHWDRLAHHTTEAGQTERAIEYWRRAGERAVERSAYVEAIAHLRTGLKLLESLPETPKRTELELALLLVLGVSLQPTLGAGAREVGELYTRARNLGLRLGKGSEHFTVLWGLWRYQRQAGNYEEAKKLLEEMLALAEEKQDPALFIEAYHAGWTTRYFTGDLKGARDHVGLALDLYDPERHSRLAFRFGGHDARVCGLTVQSLASWILGFPETALQLSKEALALARQLNHPGTLTLAIDEAAQLYYVRREPAAVQAQAEALIELAETLGFDEYRASARLLREWALVAQGRSGGELQQWRNANPGERLAGQEIEEPLFRAALADAYRCHGNPNEALAVVAEALEVSSQSGIPYWDAELLRLQGDMLLACNGKEAAIEAENCYRQAIAVAQGQEAKSLELRATTSLARLWRHQGSPAKTRELLAPVYGWFTEGFDTADLKNAKALLDELA